MRAMSLMIAASAALSGCDRSPRPDPAVAAPRGASYTYDIRGADGSSMRGQAETLTVSAGGTEVSVQGGRLTVGGKSYGSLKDGDSIVVDEGGKVSVNGAPRSP